MMIAAAVFISAPARAFSVYPLKYLITADPGTNTAAAVTVKNDGAADGIFRLSVLGARQDEKGRVILQPISDRAEEWVEPEFASVFLKAGEERAVNFRIAVPKGAEPGAHYLGLAAEETAAAEGAVGLKARLATLLTLQIAGVAREELLILRWRPAQKFLVNKDWRLDWEIKNVGTIDIPVTAKAVIKNWRGKTISESSVLSDEILILDGRRSDSLSILSAFAPTWPGKYLAQLQINYGRTSQTVSSSTAVWYLPVWSIAAAGIIILAIIHALIRKKHE